MIKNSFCFFVLCFLLLGRGGEVLAAVADARSSILPATVSVSIGSTFAVSVKINTGNSVDLLSGLEFQIAYDKAKINYVKSEAMSGFEILNSVIDSSGTLTYKMVELGASSGGLVEVAKITFKGVSTGALNLQTKSVKLLIVNKPTVWDIANNVLSRVTVAALPTATLTPVPTATLIPTPIPVPGDVDGNRIVDLLDFAIWKNEYLRVATTKRADLDKNGSVELVDFAIWKKGYLKY